jgi:ATP-dependent Clp protease ATP-binding subunit ClpB
MTSNVGSTFLSEPGRDEETMRRQVMDALRGHFRPEFLNRIDEIVFFHRLSEKQLMEVVEKETKLLARRLAERKITLELSPAAEQLIAREGFDPVFGARPIRRAIQRLVLDPLAQRVLSGEFPEGSSIYADVRDGKMEFFTQEYAKPPEEEREPVGVRLN